MNIKTVLYIGKFTSNHNTENYVTHALQKEGVKVIRRSHLSEADYDYARMVNLIKSGEVDLLLFSKARHKHAKALIQLCREHNVLTACWQFDLYWGYRGKGLMPPQFWADYLFTTDGGNEKAFKKHGMNHHLLRQGIHEPEAKLLNREDKVWDIVFVGSDMGHNSRRRLLKFLVSLKETYRYKHFTTTRGLQLNNALGKSKIVIGDTYPSPHYWSNRIYEITGRGGFLLHPKTEGLDSEFVDGEHYVSYSRDSKVDLVAKIEQYLSDEKERERIRLAGFSHTKANYTYGHRVRELLQILESHST